MVASGVGQYSINVKSNLKDFYGSLTKAQRTMKELTEKKNQLQIDSSQLDKLRDKAQRIAAEIKELRQQKTEIKLGTREVENADEELKNLDKKIASLSRQKMEVEADIQPIRTANTELYKVDQEIDRINNQKVDIKFSDSMKNVGENISKMGDTILEKFDPLTSKLNQMFGFGLIEKGIDSVTDMVKESVDSAVERIDTLNNYPKIMKQMGYANDDVTKSVTVLKASVSGLPTSLTDITKSAQSFAILTGSATKGAQAAGALNDAFLACNASAATAEQGTQDYSKMLAEGKVNLQDWNSIAGDMPYALQKVAESFGLAGSSAKKDLYEKLKDGDITMEQLNDRFIQLDGGANGFAATARAASGGIGTAFSNMHTSVTRGVAAIITSFDKILQDANLGGISGVASKIGSTLEKGLDDVAASIEKNKGTILKFVDTLERAFSQAFAAAQKFDFGAFFDGLGKGLKGLKNDGFSIINFIKPLFEILGKVAGDKNTPEMLGKLIPRLFELGLALKAIGTATKVSGTVGGFLGKLTGLKLPKIPSFGGKTDEGGLPVKNIGLKDLKDLGMKMLTLAGLSANIFLAAKAMEEVNKVGDLKSLQPKMLAIAEAITGMGVISAALGKANELLGGSVTSGLLLVVGVSADLFLVAKALEGVANIDGNFGSLQSKIGQIALAVTEIGVLAGVIGLVVDTGIGAAALTSGLLAIIGIAGTLYLVAEALDTVSKLDLDSDAIQENIKTISKAIKSMSKVTFDENPFKQLSKILSQFLDLALVGELIGIGKELESIQGISLNREKVMEKITAITDSLSYLTETIKLSSKSGVFKEIGKLLKTFVDVGVLSAILKISGQLGKLPSLNREKVMNKITSISDSLNYLTDGIKVSAKASIFKEVSKLLKSIVDDKILDAFVSISGQLDKLPTLNREKMMEKITAIADSLNYLTDGIKVSSGDGAWKDFGKLVKSFIDEGIIKSFVNIADQMAQLPNLNREKVMEKITAISDSLSYLTGTINVSSIGDEIGEVGKLLKTIVDQDILNSFMNISGNLIQLPTLNREKTFEKITAVLDSLNYLTDGISVSSIGKLVDEVGKLIKSVIDGMILNSFTDISNELVQLPVLNREKTLEKITAVSDSLNYLTDSVKASSIGDLAGEVGKLLKSVIDEGILNAFLNISSQLAQLQGFKLDEKKIGKNIDSIRTLIGKITSGSFWTAVKDFFSSGFKISDLTSAYDMFDELNNIADSLENLQGRSLMIDSLTNDEGTGEIDIIQKAINSLSKFATTDIKNNLTGISTALDSMVNDLTQTFPPEFTTLGNTFAKKINSAFKKKLDLQSALKSKISSLSTSGASEVGSKIAKAINDSIKNSLNIGDSIHNSIVKALSENYSTKINVDLLTNKVDNSGSSTKYPTVVMAGGGRVAANSQLQDSPEKPLLANGEYVIPEKIVKALGTPFFDKLRNGQISRTFAGLAQSVSNTTSSVVNNIYNNQTTNQHMNVYPSGHQDMMMISNRRIRV